MAEMTITYKPKIGSLDTKAIQSTVISCINTYGDKKNIYQMIEGDNTKYLAHKPLAVIRLLDGGKIQISDSDQKVRAIKKTKSKLLKIVKGLQLN